MIHKNFTKQEINKTYQEMLENNPHFAKFVDDNEWKKLLPMDKVMIMNANQLKI